VREQALGVLGTGPMAVHQALLFRQWSDDVRLLLHTAPALTDEEAEQLASRGIAVVEGEVAEVEVDGEQLSGVRLSSGEVVPLEALVVMPRFTARADLLVQLGLEPVALEVDGHVLATRVEAAPTGATSVPGVFVAGNVTDPMAGVIGAAAAGVTAASGLNADLLAEDVRLAVEAHRAARATTAVAG
jgi:thioredoxin reductase